QAVRHRGGPERNECEAGDHGLEIVSAIESVFELREISRDVFFSHGSVGPHEGGFDIAQRGIDPFESRGASRLFAASGFIEVWRHPAWVTAAKHARPSETILAPGLRAVLASFRIAKLLKALTGRRMI